MNKELRNEMNEIDLMYGYAEQTVSQEFSYILLCTFLLFHFH